MGSPGEEDLGGQRERVVCRQKHHPQLKNLMLTCPKECGPRCEIFGIVSRRLIVRPSLCTRDLHRTCTCIGWWTRCALHGYCDLFRAHASWGFTAMMRFVQAISVHGKVASSAQHKLPVLPCPIHYTRDYGQTSSWYNKGWAPSKSTYSGWSKRGHSRLSRTVIVTTDAMSGMIMHREDRIRPGRTTRDIGCCRCRDCGRTRQEPGNGLCEQCRRQ